MAELTPIRIEQELKLEIKHLIEKGYFSTITEFVKESIRKNLENYRKQEALKALASLKGSVKEVAVTREDRAKAVLEGLDSGRDILKEYGLK